jgi:hypothetical protein
LIHLHIKGDMIAAWREADARGIEFATIAHRLKPNGFSECFASATHDHIHKVRVWFVQGAGFDQLVPGFGYPSGTLLHYSQDTL